MLGRITCGCKSGGWKGDSHQYRLVIVVNYKYGVTPEGNRLEALTTLVEAYEEQHYFIRAPDPVKAISIAWRVAG